MGNAALTKERWDKLRAAYPKQEKSSYMDAVINSLLENARKGDVAAIEWLASHGIVTFPNIAPRW